MTDEDKAALAAAIADELLDAASFETRDDRERAAGCVAERIEHMLFQQGWMPRATTGRVSDWARQVANLPEHHVNRSVLTSQLAELAAILHGR